MTPLRWLHRVEDWIGGAFIAVVVASVSLQIFCRYVLGNALPWPEEVAKFCFVWGTFFGAVIGVRHRGHISIEAFIARIPTRPRLAIRVATYGAILAILGVLAVSTLEMARMSSTSILPAINVPLAWLYAPLGVCSILMGIDFLVLMADAVGRFMRGEDSAAPDAA